MTGQPPILSLEEMANAYCLMMANAYRLIEDGEKLAGAARPLGAIGSFQLATHELIRGHLVGEAVLLEDNDTAGWENFWVAMTGRVKRIDILKRDIHTKIYASADSRSRYEQSFALLALDFTANSFDAERGQFLTPGGDLAGFSTMEEAAKAYYEYVMGLYHAFNFYGLPNPATQVQTFWGLRLGARNAALVNP